MGGRRGQDAYHPPAPPPRGPGRGAAGRRRAWAERPAPEEAPLRRLVIVNPVAPRIRGARETLQELGAVPGTRVVSTSGPGDAERRAAEAAAAGVTQVVAAGGDGTVHEVVNGLAGRTTPPVLGLLPLGTGNDFARGLGVPLRLREAARFLTGGTAREVDVVRMGGGRRRYLVNCAVGGVGGRVDRHLSPAAKRRWRALAYRVYAAWSLRDLPEHRVVVGLDGEDVERTTFSVAVANGRYVGGGIPVAPAARADDGLLDVVVFPAGSRLRAARLLLAAFRGRHARLPGVVYRRARRVSVRARPRMWFNVDGEPFPDAALSLEVLPRRLRVLAPRASAGPGLAPGCRKPPAAPSFPPVDDD